MACGMQRASWRHGVSCDGPWRVTVVWSAGRVASGLSRVACGVWVQRVTSRCVLWRVAIGACRSGVSRVVWIINLNVQACCVWRVTVVSRGCGVSRWRVAACGVWSVASLAPGVSDGGVTGGEWRVTVACVVWPSGKVACSESLA